MNETAKNLKQAAIVLLGAAVGGAVGYFVFFWVAQQGFYGLVIPGGLLGAGASIGKTKCRVTAIICGVLALGLGLFSEWRFAPFIDDPSLGYFLAHITQLQPMTWIMILLGTAIGFWMPFEKGRKA